MTLQWYRWPDGTRLRHEYNGVVIPAHRVVDGSTTGGRWMNLSDKKRFQEESSSWVRKEVVQLEDKRDRLRDTLKELTTEAERQCRYDTVLRQKLTPYCKAARKVLEGAGNGE